MPPALVIAENKTIYLCGYQKSNKGVRTIIQILIQKEEGEKTVFENKGFNTHNQFGILLFSSFLIEFPSIAQPYLKNKLYMIINLIIYIYIYTHRAFI